MLGKLDWSCFLAACRVQTLFYLSLGLLGAGFNRGLLPWLPVRQRPPQEGFCKRSMVACRLSNLDDLVCVMLVYTHCAVREYLTVITVITRMRVMCAHDAQSRNAETCQVPHPSCVKVHQALAAAITQSLLQLCLTTPLGSSEWPPICHNSQTELTETTSYCTTLLTVHTGAATTASSRPGPRQNTVTSYKQGRQHWANALLVAWRDMRRA